MDVTIVVNILAERLHFIFLVAVGFSLRFSTSNGYMKISHKLCNLKDAATRTNACLYLFGQVLFGTGGQKSLNLCKINLERQITQSSIKKVKTLRWT